MLANFCDKCLRTDVTCSTVSTEGYEVTNLVNNSSKGFLAYSCIKPPIHVDFVLICNIKISHVIVWPQIGAQKSCGFQLSVKSSDTCSEPFTVVSSAFLQKEDSGVLFYRRDISHHSEIVTPPNFMSRYIKAVNLTNYTNVVRLSILKTDNSVPALAKVEIWGSVSPKCGKDLVTNVTALWMNRLNNIASLPQTITHPNNSGIHDKRQLDVPKFNNTLDVPEFNNTSDVPEFSNILDVPEDFLDPITFEIMTQPIILPSGKIIDQKTLEKHSHNEALWGRPPSDPFTGIRFNDIHRPIAAVPLKARIDKFLIENSNREEVKKLPRVLGSKLLPISKNIEIISCNSITSLTNVSIPKSKVVSLKRTLSNEENNVSAVKRTLLNEENVSSVKRTFHGHLLPIVSVKYSGASLNRNSIRKTIEPIVSVNKTTSKEEIEKQNSAIEEKLNLSIQATKAPTCKCCTNNIFYKLPCEHIICRKALLSLEKNVCSICKLEFRTNDPQRFYL